MSYIRMLVVMQRIQKISYANFIVIIVAVIYYYVIVNSYWYKSIKYCATNIKHHQFN